MLMLRPLFSQLGEMALDTMKRIGRKKYAEIYRLLIALLLVCGSGGSALCVPCAVPQFMVCHVQADVAMRADCCCGAVVCGAIEEPAPAYLAVESAPQAQSTLPVGHVFTAKSAHTLPRLSIPIIQPAPPPLFQLYCSLLI